jgi:hypothetical protein
MLIRVQDISVHKLHFHLLNTRFYVGLSTAFCVLKTSPIDVSCKMRFDKFKLFLFSFAFWPFSIKLLWAPIVDSIFISNFGRRKTWLVPVQYLIGITMLLLSQNVTWYLGEEKDGPDSPQVYPLTLMFFFLNFLAATQDIAVDGWALTMLLPENVGYASTCNSVGQTAGKNNLNLFPYML